jgi:uncharacterized Tic20 family protein
VPAAKVTGLPTQEIVAVYSVVAVIVEIGVALVVGTVTPAMAGVSIVVAVAGKTAEITPELAEFVAVAPATVKKFEVTPTNVYPVFGERVIVAV